MRALLLIIVCLGLLASCDDSSDDPAIQVHRAFKEGDVDRLVEILMNEESDRWSSEYDRGKTSFYSPSGEAANALLQLLKDNDKALRKIEAKISETLQAESAQWKRASLANAITILNLPVTRDMEAHYRNLAYRGLAADPDEEGSEVRSPSELQVSPVARGTVVDAIVVSRLRHNKKKDTVRDFQPRLNGKTKAEISLFRKTISTLGFVYERELKKGEYVGDCTGGAYQIVSDLYVIDVESSTVVSAITLTGEMPPAGTYAINKSHCSRWGKEADHNEYLVVSDR